MTNNFDSLTLRVLCFVKTESQVDQVDELADIDPAAVLAEVERETAEANKKVPLKLSAEEQLMLESSDDEPGACGLVQMAHSL